MRECDLIVVRPFGFVLSRDLPARDGASVVVIASARVVGTDAVTAGTAQQLIYGLPQGLPEEVPERYIDYGGGTDLRPGAGEP
jgi:hypothetical protein